ncbi:MAG: DUF2254 domain-containing protein [Rhodothermales bacterium]
MKATLLTFWENVRSSYWFIPSLMALAAVLLSSGAIYFDGVIGSGWMDDIPWLYANKPDGARALLSTISGSMITVAGVTFSITIASVAYATGQFGPRLLTNFMQDRGNQVTLGTFIATFLYCLLVLRTIRSADERTGGSAEVSGDFVGAFVPHAAILIALALTLASVAVLIFFIHHVPDSIHISNVIAKIGRELNAKIDMLFPEMLGQKPPEELDGEPEADVPERFFSEATPVCADGNGYIEYLDSKGLLEIAQSHDLILRVEYRPGDFVVEEMALVYAWPASRLDDETKNRILRAFAWGRKRTQAQDAMFLVNELVEIAGRALSPGVNDPFTAISCLDWLSSALTRLAHRTFPSVYRYDEEGNLRIIARPYRFEDFARAVFDQIRPYAHADRNAALHMMKVIGDVGLLTESRPHRETLLAHATKLRDGCREGLAQEADVETLEERYETVARLLRHPETRETEASKREWLAGSS